MKNLKVMMATEGTYPYHQGGVSTWCDILIKRLTEVEFAIYCIIMNPFVTQKFDLPPKTKLIKVPLWGTEEPSEHLTTPFSNVYTAKRRTADAVVRTEFIPLFIAMLEEILSDEKDSRNFGMVLTGLHQYFQEYDYKKSFKSLLAWDIYKKTLLAYAAEKSACFNTPSVFELNQTLGWLYRFFTILNTPLPPVDVSHSAAAAFCGIPCVLAKIENNTPYLLTEHGVYLREQYLSLSKRGYPSFLNTFLMKLIRSVTGLSYTFADQISPVCYYNTRWEKEFGVKAKSIRVIYNGVDKEMFSPSWEFNRNKYPTVVSVARIDPAKDIITLIKAAEIVRETLPEVRFIVYGSVTVPEYLEECLRLIEEKALKGSFILAGHTDNIPAAYRSGDVIALSSITEAFPYSVVEAMMSGRAIVSTDVGGIKEALGECGFLVKPREPAQLAAAILKLLQNPELRHSLGEEARQRALSHFTIERVLDLYLESYRRLAQGKVSSDKDKNREQKLLAEKGYALMAAGYYKESLSFFRQSIQVAPLSYAVPVMLMEIAKVYNFLGNYDRALVEMKKAELMIECLEDRQTALIG